MVTAQEALASMQTQALDAIKSGQAAAIQAVQAWSQAVQKVTPEVPGVPSTLPSGVQDTVGDPTAIVDSVYDFAGKLIEANKEFVHQLLAASTPENGSTARPAAKTAAK